MVKKALGVVKNIVEEAGMGISYAYEDLIFLEHNSFLLQFTDQEDHVVVHVNNEADESTVNRDIERLQEIAPGHKMQFFSGNTYTLKQGDGDSIIIEFSTSS